MTIKLVTDSTCDLPSALINELDIHIVPINIQFKTTSYKENITITPDEFYQKIIQNNTLPKTSQPAVGDFLHLYKALSKTTGQIISIHLTSKLSGTYQSATLAAAMVQNQVNVTVIDSLAGSAGLGWMLYDAANLIAQDQSITAIKKHLEAQRDKITIFFAIDTLQFAQMSGRVGKLGTLLGTLLNIKPVIGLENGLIDVHDKVRSKKAAIEQIVALTQEKVQDHPVNLAVVHAQAAERAKTLMDIAKPTMNVQNTYIKDLAISLAVHFGPGALGLITYPAS